LCQIEQLQTYTVLRSILHSILYMLKLVQTPELFNLQIPAGFQSLANAFKCIYDTVSEDLRLVDGIR